MLEQLAQSEWPVSQRRIEYDQPLLDQLHGTDRNRGFGETPIGKQSGRQPVGRMARPEEIAGAALYLASDEASFVTGVPFYIDGGWTAGT